MAFTLPPSYSKNSINRAGDALVADDSNEEARTVLNEWRACHAYPINTFKSTLYDKLAKLGLGETSIVAQRLKRAPTMIDKLRRFPGMNLARMQDIGGVRAVVTTMSNVRALIREYRNSKFQHTLVGEKDYITVPKEDGYRSHHLIYEYQNKRAKAYNGLLVELQVRTKLQHIWATAVETMGLYLNQPLKSRQGDEDWLDFFALTSSAFAYKEGLPAVPRFANLSEKETYIKVAEMENKLQVLDKLSKFAFAVRTITEKEKRAYYHLITLDLPRKIIRLQGFAKKNFSAAKKAYAEAEKKQQNESGVDTVLVAVGSINSLERAYPNFFLDTNDFAEKVREIIRKS